MQAISKDIRCSSAVLRFVLLKAWSACKTEILPSLEELLNLAVHLPKLAPVALIKDKDYLFIAVLLHNRLIFRFLNGIGHLLDRGDNELLISILYLLHQLVGTFCHIHAVSFIGIKIINGFCVQVVSIYKKEYLFYSIFL